MSQVLDSIGSSHGINDSHPISQIHQMLLTELMPIGINLCSDQVQQSEYSNYLGRCNDNILASTYVESFEF